MIWGTKDSEYSYGCWNPTEYSNEVNFYFYKSISLFNNDLKILIFLHNR